MSTQFTPNLVCAKNKNGQTSLGFGGFLFCVIAVS
jgi:hypothetical protein